MASMISRYRSSILHEKMCKRGSTTTPLPRPPPYSPLHDPSLPPSPTKKRGPTEPKKRDQEKSPPKFPPARHYETAWGRCWQLSLKTPCSLSGQGRYHRAITSMPGTAAYRQNSSAATNARTARFPIYRRVCIFPPTKRGPRSVRLYRIYESLKYAAVDSVNVTSSPKTKFRECLRLWSSASPSTVNCQVAKVELWCCPRSSASFDKPIMCCRHFSWGYTEMPLPCQSTRL